MITVGLATSIRASRERVWAALSDAAEVVRWRPGVVDRMDPTVPFPEPSRRVRWRCRVHGLPVVLHETPLEVLAGERIRSRIALGPFRFEETFTLSAAPGEPGTSRLGIRIAARNEMPLPGGALDRFAVRRFATELSASYLQAMRDWCEGAQVSARPVPLPSLPAPVVSLAAAAR